LQFTYAQATKEYGTGTSPKENIQHFKKFFSMFVGHFCPPGSGSRDPIESNPEPIRIQIRIRIHSTGYNGNKNHHKSDLPRGFLLLEEDGPLAELSEAGEMSLFRDSFLGGRFMALAAAAAFFSPTSSASNSESSSADLAADAGGTYAWEKKYYGTITIFLFFYGSGSDFWQVTVLVPVPAPFLTIKSK
jgi:hypothetical protein